MNSSHEKKKERFENYFPLTLSIAIILTGILYIIAVCHLYFTGGNQPFSRERVGEYLLWLAVPSAITVIMIVIGSVLRRIAGKDRFTSMYQGTATAAFRMKSRLKNLSHGFDYNNAPDSIKARIENQKAIKNKFLWTAIAITGVSLIPSFLILLDFDRYTIPNLNGDIASAAAVILGGAILSLIAWSAYAVVKSNAVEEELFAIKDAVRENPALYKNIPKDDKSSILESGKIISVLRIVILLLAAALIVLGVFNGGMSDVLAKAVKICTECIGLG